MRVRVLRAADTPGGYVEDFGEIFFSFWVEIFSFFQFRGSPPPFVEPLGWQMGPP